MNKISNYLHSIGSIQTKEGFLGTLAWDAFDLITFGSFEKHHNITKNETSLVANATFQHENGTVVTRTITIPSEIRVVEIRYVNASTNETIRVEHQPLNQTNGTVPAVPYSYNASHPLSPNNLNTTHNNQTINSTSIHNDSIWHANNTIFYPKDNSHDPDLVKALNNTTTTTTTNTNNTTHHTTTTIN